MVDGFLGRWSQRKQAARAARTVDEALARPVSARDAGLARDQVATPAAREPIATPATDADAAGEAAPLSMQDVASLDSRSDFKPFVARSVAPEVRNAALKKLFADPHFNRIDGLDVYIGDYSLPDPLPLALLRKMASAKVLNLFEEDDDADKTASAAVDAAVAAPAQTVAQSAAAHHAEPEPEAPSPDLTTPDHDDTDMRLQPDHAAGRAPPGRVAE